MKKATTLTFLLFFTLNCFSQNQDDVSEFEFERVTIDDFSIKLPKGCTLNEELSQSDQNAFCYTNSDNSFVFAYMYFPTSDDFSATERAVGEANQLGIEIANSLPISVNLSEDEEDVMFFIMNPGITVGVSDFYPEENIGLFVYILSKNEPIGDIFTSLYSIKRVQ